MLSTMLWKGTDGNSGKNWPKKMNTGWVIWVIFYIISKGVDRVWMGFDFGLSGNGYRVKGMDWFCWWTGSMFLGFDVLFIKTWTRYKVWTWTWFVVLISFKDQRCRN